MWPERDDLRPKRADFQLERTDLMPERLNLKPESPALRPPRPSWAVAPKGSMTYAFTHMGDFLLLVLHTPPPLGLYLSLEGHIPVLRPKSQPQGPNPSPEPEIWASRPGSGPLG